MMPGIFSRMKTHPNGNAAPTFDDIDIFATATAAGTTSAVITWPASITSGMGIFIHVSNKLQAARATVPSGFRRINHWTASTLNNGTDAGPSVSSLFYKEAEGGETGTLTIDVPDGNSVLATMFVIEKDPEAYLNFIFDVGFHNAVNTTSYVATSKHNHALEPGDWVLMVDGVNTDSYGWSGQDLTQTDSTFEELTEEIHETSTNQGNDQEQFASFYRVTTAGASGKLVRTATSSGASSGPANPTGVSIFIIIRQSSTPQVWEPSGLYITRASDVVDDVAGSDGSDYADGNRVSSAGPDSGPSRFQIVTKDGRPVFKVSVNLTTGINYRSELYLLPIDPGYSIGSQIIEEFTLETHDWPWNPLEEVGIPGEPPVGEVIFSQNHPGSGGRPGPNHPIWYLAFTYPGQSGFDNGGGASGGKELQVVMNVQDGTGNYIRNRYASVVWAANQSYKIKYHIRFDYASGSPCLKVWVDDVLLFENYTHPTVATVAEDLGDDPGTGSNPNVGGAPKKFIYHQMCKDEAARTANLAAGHKGVVFHAACIKTIVQFPEDVDYITDVTDNDNPIYDWVSTADE